MRGVPLGPCLLLAFCVLPGIEGFSVPLAAGTAKTPSMASMPKSKAAKPDDVPAALVEHAVAWASANGLGMVVNDKDKGLFTSTHLPFSLLPYGERLYVARFKPISFSLWFRCSRMHHILRPPAAAPSSLSV